MEAERERARAQAIAKARDDATVWSFVQAVVIYEAPKQDDTKKARKSSPDKAMSGYNRSMAWANRSKPAVVTTEDVEHPVMNETMYAIIRIIRKNNVSVCGLSDHVRPLLALRTHCVSREMMEDPSSMLITGAQVVDAHSNMLLLEGSAGPEGGLAKLFDRITPTYLRRRGLRLLYNPSVCVSERYYSDFHAELRTFYLSEPLEVLAEVPRRPCSLVSTAPLL